MLPSKSVRLFVLCALSANIVFSQCYDLTSTRLYEPKGRFQEWWDKPIWNAKPGEGNFYVDEPSWGAFEEFALFSVGIVRKTPGGWVSYRSERIPEIWVDPTPKRSGSLRYVLPYQAPPPTAVYRVTSDLELEKWSVEPTGIVRYERYTRGPERILEAKKRNAPPIDDLRGYKTNEEGRGVLDLKTGDYRFEMHVVADGTYRRKIPAGVHLERTETFHARAVLKEVTCPASLRAVSFTEGAPAMAKMNAPAACVVKVSGNNGKSGKGWEFLQNPNHANSRSGCVQVFDLNEK